ncbi:nucleoside triphosphate pyrophosphohydrolase [Methylocystis sp. 9N]|uniref:Nucleoside triphosphate pyrophosphohydrolase n=1 Tax=Methylocystis borbori TaxID=3118750 RepID=A0ABU7XDP4_9HYPH
MSGRPPGDVARLIEIMAALRTPGSGCPWDLEQDFRSIAPYTIEEAYEVAEAVERGDLDELKDELGDLLLQVVFHARMAQETDAFAFADVVDAICAKLIRRHPHVFGDGGSVDSERVAAQWSEIKAREKAEKGQAPASLLEGVPLALPALTRAVKLQQKASAVGFDWNDARHVLGKIREETEEVAAELAAPGAVASPALEEEVGDLLFVVANLARHAKVDPEQALRAANAKFERRFRHIEQRLAAAGRAPAQASLDEMEELWVEAKGFEKAR